MAPTKGILNSYSGPSLTLPGGPLPSFHEHSACETTSFAVRGTLSCPGNTPEPLQGQGNLFILKISYREDINRSSSSVQRDPGTMAVEDFLTEEQEAELLKHWND
jgi:hypothetical protein